MDWGDLDDEAQATIRAGLDKQVQQGAQEFEAGETIALTELLAELGVSSRDYLPPDVQS